MVNDELGKRMKNNYENIFKSCLMRRVPVALRIDGKAFHTFTRGFDKPYDKILLASMQETTKRLCESIQGCVFGYTQSDEITLILTDYRTFTTDAWFGYEVQKLCSIGASMATAYFNQIFTLKVNEWRSSEEFSNSKSKLREEAYLTAIKKGAMFDCRCFNIPKEEVANLLYWRQLDATRNSIQLLGQNYFSHKELNNKTCNDIQGLLFEKFNINWNDYPPNYKRGTCCFKKNDKWFIDYNTPRFNNNWDYINKFL